MQNVLSLTTDFNLCLIYLIFIVPCTLIKIYFMFRYYVQATHATKKRRAFKY